MANFAVLGAGSWGTALAVLLAGEQNHKVKMWEFFPEAAKKLAKDRENREFLADVMFPDNLEVTNDLPYSLDGVDGVLVVVPSQLVRSVLKTIEGDQSDKIWIGASKGIENKTLKRMSEVTEEFLGKEVARRYVALSGPSHAEEVGKSIPTTVVAGCHDLETAQTVQEWFSGQTFRVYASDDPVGVELGASLKNVIAIATGICDGMGFGDNTRGALITRGLHEISRLGSVLGGKRETFAGLSGMGDLITTCTSKHSRNRYVGEQLGRGRSLEDILKSMHMVAEGVATTRSAWDLAQREGVEMPITEKVYEILFEGASAREAVIQLMTRSLKVERHL
ncbi:NAD(P)H-dependent glycerol-3-phosphate dehydrogenase [bacterium]|nr:NAD(P)H-dependent glycerol-3-phosphate dehydrogenase [bacterium]